MRSLEKNIFKFHHRNSDLIRLNEYDDGLGFLVGFLKVYSEFYIFSQFKKDDFFFD